MLPLSGLDAGFLYGETPTSHAHTLKIAVLDIGDLAEAGGFERFRRELGDALPLLPPFRRRLLEVPLGLDHPRWVEDRDFCLDHHVRLVRAPAPGDARALARVASAVAERPLDRRRPLWEITMVEGLAHGHTGFVVKLHHAVADGLAANELLLNVLGPARRARARTEWTPEAPPSRAHLLSSGVEARVRRLRGLPALARSTGRGLVEVIRQGRSGAVTAPAPFETEPLPFNAALTPRRALALVELPLGRLRAIGRRAGVSLNDAFLALCTGALRAWLTGDGVLLRRPLVAGVPVGLGTDGAPRLHGNRVSNLFAGLPVQLAEPGEHLAVVRRGMIEAKERHRRLGPDLLERWAEFAPPVLYGAAARAWSRLGLSNHFRPPINLIVSTVPGPSAPLAFDEYRMVSFHSIGPILEGIGLNITAWSYVDRLEVTILACPDHDGDPWALAAAFPGALDALDLAVPFATVAPPSAAAPASPPPTVTPLAAPRPTPEVHA